MRCDQQEGGVIRCLSSATFENAMSANKNVVKMSNWDGRQKKFKLVWETEIKIR